MPTIDKFLQIAAAAELLGVCQNTLRNWGRTGKITEYRHPLNNYRLYDQEELQRIAADIESPPAVNSSHDPEERTAKRRKPK